VVVISLLAFSSVFYGAARYYSPSLVLYVVEQSLTQKAPAGTDLAALHERLHALLSATPDQKARMEKMLRISEYLEKVQRLTRVELNELMEAKGTRESPAF